MREVAIKVPSVCDGKCKLAYRKPAYVLTYTCPFRDKFVPARAYLRPVKACRDAELPQID